MQEDCYFDDPKATGIYIHKSSYVDTPCQIGNHTSIMHFSHVMPHAIIGSFCEIGRNVVIESGVIVGDYVRIMNNIQLNSGVILENHVYCGSSVVFDEGCRIRALPNKVSKISPTLVREGALISANATVASGHIIGQYAFIEAGSIVDRNIPDFAIAYGNPLKLAGWRCKCGQSLTLTDAAHEAKCAHCNRRYIRQSKWKIAPLISRTDAVDPHSKPNTTIRNSQRIS